MNRSSKNEDRFERCGLALLPAVVALIVRITHAVHEGLASHLLSFVAWAVFQPSLPAAEGQP